MAHHPIRGLNEDRGVMAADSSFDVVSDFDQQELVNALDQARREIATRYDFKGSKVAYELGRDAIVLTADDEYRAGAAKDLLESKAVRRGLSLKIFEWGKIEPAGGGTVRQEVKLKRGLTSEQAKATAHTARGCLRIEPVLAVGSSVGEWVTGCLSRSRRTSVAVGGCQSRTSRSTANARRMLWTPPWRPRGVPMVGLDT